MAEGRKDSSSGHHRYYTRRSRKPKEPAIVLLSDSSSSESNDEEVPNVSCDQPSLKSGVLPKNSVDNPELTPECPVCLQPCIHPARLPCGHIFCFLCLKGIAQQSRRCAMCRQEISPDYLDRPDLLQIPENPIAKEAESEDAYQWFYEGRNGWWQYDERTSKELEASYKSGIRTCELLIAGFLYTADFDAMVQIRRNEPHRRRRIKRDLNTIPSKGIAGIRSVVNVDTVSEQLSSLTLSDSPTEQDEA
ncbi:E3 ubiquitin-protein ligase RNF146-A-like isoform X1 [Macrosteles quadrilineatus]|uniref:E3 ubiquitin-protein ligase RNF146-A-like isoform X1 n=1 Tax=Macrosteles quadrilineatus TaxID=74068 RepID=UPI0023E2A96E|nr:E3 ubiquitin-protein ligase RNF146-A-like isoform X1 [Macrosteles quadrilineatus]